MNALHEAIWRALEADLHALQRAMAGLTPVEARWQPTLHTPPMAWVVWHMARTEDRWVNQYLRGTTEVWRAEGWADRFRMAPEPHGFGQTSEEVRAMPEIPLTDLMAYGDAVHVVTRPYLDHATDADLMRTSQHPRMGTFTGSWIVGHILIEASQHVGQVALIRGMIRGLGHEARCEQSRASPARLQQSDQLFRAHTARIVPCRT
jgi:hypothetical protein